jgi:hypothetical protein
MATPPCDEQKDNASCHPFVGIVDHVVVMSLKEKSINPTLLRDESGIYQHQKKAKSRLVIVCSDFWYYQD